MEIQFADSFAKSLKNLMWHESRVYKFYSIFRYGIPHFIANIWRFKKNLWNHAWWDYSYTLEMLHTSISIMEKKYNEKQEFLSPSRKKVLVKMQRSLELIKNILDDNYMDKAEEVLGKLPKHTFEFEDVGNGNVRLVDNDTLEETAQWKKTYEYAQMIEETEWTELWNIFKGQSNSEYEEYKKGNLKKYSQEEINNGDDYYDWFDGTNMRSWWD
jgi:hypothetical protein